MDDEELYFSKLEQEKNDKLLEQMYLRESLLHERDKNYTYMLNKIQNDKLIKVFLGYIYNLSDEEKEYILFFMFEKEETFLEIFHKNLPNFDKIIEEIKNKNFV
ncbi:hypothetical protein H311_04395 [Anncaliia algerae PRA109]|nr:hypothetical protein H311_04395 [Anncaliia algerae PRA109]